MADYGLVSATRFAGSVADPAKVHRGGLVAVAEFELAPAAARTGRIRVALRVLGLHPKHHVGGRAAALEELPHHAHQRARMGEEELEAGAEVVLARFAVLEQREAVLRTAAAAEEAHVAFSALSGQRVAFVVAELAHLRRGDEIDQRRRRDVAELLPRLDEMIAGVEIAVVFERRPIAAGRRVDAEEMAPEIGFERDVEELDEHAPHIAPHPFLENVDEELAILLAANRAVGDQISGLGVEKALARARPIAPALVGDGERLGRRPLDDRNELDPRRAEFVAEEAVDPSPMLLVGGVDGAEDIELD